MEREDKDNEQAVLGSIKSWKIVVPIVIGLGVTGVLLYRDYTPDMFSSIELSGWSFLWLLISFMLMATRDVGYMERIRILSSGELNWRQAFRIIMLWEFASAATPSAVGGTSVAVFFVNREGVPMGKATGMVMVTSFLDELFFAIVFPLTVLLIGFDKIFGDEGIASSFVYFAWLGYGIKVGYILLLSYGLFGKPELLKKLLVAIFKLPFLRRWQDKIAKVGDDLIETSHVYRSWPMRKWIKAFITTCASWIARYWVVNALIVAFFGISILDIGQHFVVFGKQLAMWIMMLVSPTPGGAGFAEWVFKEFLQSFIPLGASVAMAFCWRLVSYYPYLIMGAILVPRWVKDIVKKGDKK